MSSVTKQYSFTSYVLYKLLACYFVVALLVYGVMLAYTYHSLKGSQKSAIDRIAEMFIKQLPPVPLGMDNEAVRASLTELLNSGIRQSGVLGAVLKTNIRSVSLFVKHSSIDTDLSPWQFPIYQQGFGDKLVLYVSDAKIHNAFVAKMWHFGILLCAQLAILWLILRYFLVKVVKRSADIMMRELEALNLAKPEPLHGDPRFSRFSEYQTLMGGVNRMIHSLASSKQELASLNLGLEAKIKEKTASLEEKNATLVALNKKLSILANTDALTQVYNRTRFDLLFREHVEIAEKRKTRLSLLLVDLDDFKLVNDRYGHQVGDHVLKKAAQLLSDQVGDEGVVARWGGEEFAVLLPYYSLDQALLKADCLREALSEASFEEQHIHITMSVGVAQLQSEESSQHLLKRADAALYCAKEEGRDRVICSRGSASQQLPLSGLSDSEDVS